MSLYVEFSHTRDSRSVAYQWFGAFSRTERIIEWLQKAIQQQVPLTLPFSHVGAGDYCSEGEEESYSSEDEQDDASENMSNSLPRLHTLLDHILDMALAVHPTPEAFAVSIAMELKKMYFQLTSLQQVSGLSVLQ